MKTVIKCKSREEWLSKRAEVGIGASEAASIVGLSPWCSKLELWKQKTGASKPKDLSDNTAVEQGNRMEPSLRELFKAQHPELKVAYHQYDLIAQKELPWLFATLDGEITDTDGRHGVLEIKTSTPGTQANWEKWNGKVPNNYYVQVLHQLLATGYDFAVLYAALFGLNGELQIRQYEFERADCKNDMEWLLGEEKAFMESIRNGEMVGTILTL